MEPEQYNFQVGGSLRSDAPSYVQRRTDQVFYEALHSGQFCYVFNSRQMGKSSLRVRTMQRLIENGTVCVAIDMTAIGTTGVTPESWFASVLDLIVEALELYHDFDFEQWWSERSHLPIVQRFSTFLERVLLRSVTQNIVIFIDEIDTVLSLSFNLDDFFAVIRECYNQRADRPEYRRLTFALLGVATPSALIQDANRTPFNIGTAIDLTGFRLEDCEPLIRGFAEWVAEPELLMRSILDWTGGQPFLTQKVCRWVAGELEQAGGREQVGEAEDSVDSSLANYLASQSAPDFVAQLIQMRMIENWQAQDEPEHLKTIQNRLLNNEQRKGCWLGLYQQIVQQGAIVTDNSLEQRELQLSGLVVKRDGELRVYNRIYEAVFNRNWVKTELANLRDYAEQIQVWLDSEEQDTTQLLRGNALRKAQDWSAGKSLSDADYRFLAASLKWDANQIFAAAQRKSNRRILIGSAAAAVSLALATASGIFALRQIQAAALADVRLTSANSGALFLSGQPFFALLESLRAGKQLKQLSPVVTQQDTTQTRVIAALYQANAGVDDWNTLQSHQDSVNSVSFSPDGKMIASGSDDNTVKLWDVVTGRELRTFSRHQSGVNSVSFSPDGKMIASGSNDNTVKLWDVVTGRELRTFSRHQFSVSLVSFSPNGKIIASGSAEVMKLWDVATGREFRTFTGHQLGVNSVSFSPDGKIIASGSADKTVKLWDVATGRELRTFTGHQQGVTANFSPDGRTIASSSGDGTVKLWDVATGRELRTITKLNAHSVSFSPDSRTIASGNRDDTVRLWDVATGRELRTFTGHQSDINSVSFSPDGRTIASGSFDKTVKLWDIKTGKALLTLTGHQRSIKSVSFSPDGKTIASGSRDHTVKLWDVAIGRELYTFTGHQEGVNSVSFSPDGKTIASGSADKTVKLWDVATGRELRTFTGHQEGVNSVSFSPDGKTLASGSGDFTVKLWDVETGKELHTLTGHLFNVNSVSFSPDGKTLASGSGDFTVKLWDVETGKELHTLTEHQSFVNSVSFSPDGKTLASGSIDETVILRTWNLEKLMMDGCNWISAYLITHPDDRPLCEGYLGNQEQRR